MDKIRWKSIIWTEPRDETLIDRRHLQLTGLEVPQLEAELGQNSATKQHIKRATKHLQRGGKKIWLNQTLSEGSAADRLPV
jgi:hypothetical protein